MWELSPKPIKVSVLEEYKLLVSFEDGVIKTFDMQNLLHLPPFKKLADKDLFSTAHISDDGATIEWDNGSDICPDQLYRDSVS